METAAPPSVAPSGTVELPLSLLKSRLFWRLLVFCGALAIQGGSAYQHYSPDRWLYRDGSFYFNTVRGLVENGSLDQGHLHPRSWFNGRLGWNYNLTDDWSNVSVGRDGTWYPKHPLLMPLLSVPFFVAFGDVGTLIFNVLCAALAAFLAAELASAFAARWLASLIGLGIGCIPLILREAYGFNNDLFYTTLVLGAAVCLANRQMARAGLLAGFAVFAKITNVFFLVPFGLWALSTKDKKLILRFIGWACLGLGVTALTNWVLFGAPWITAYHQVLIVHNGAQEIQPHTRLFHRDFWTGLQAIWGWPAHGDPQGRGLMDVFPAYLPALLGTGLLAVRKRFVPALVFFLALTWPLVFFAKYDWYRDDFSDPIYFLCAAPLAAWLSPLFPPQEQAPTPNRSWARGLGLAAGLLVLVAAGRGALALAHRGPYTLVSDIKHAEVFLGDIPCDYFNNQVARWECSNFDRGSEWLMTGVTLDGAPVFNGEKRTMIALNPHPQGTARRIVFHPPAGHGHKLTLLYGTPDGAVGPPVQMTVLVGGNPAGQDVVAAPGLRHLEADIGAAPTTVEIDVSGQPSQSRWFYIDGTLDD